MREGETCFIAYPDAVQYEEEGAQESTKGKTAKNHLLWGDYARIRQISGSWIKIRARGRDGWVRRDRLQKNRILEVNFVDIGQGDGCHIQTPDDRALVIDAGEADNMYRFLRWRFGRFTRPFTFESFVITHPDKDHYLGFRALFEDPNVRVTTLFHNSIVEQCLDGRSSLGREARVDGKRILTGLVHTTEELRAITDSAARRGRRLYPNMLKLAVDDGRVRVLRSAMADPDAGVAVYLPGFTPQDGRGMTLRVLGPVPMTLDGQAALPILGDEGVTKNGHSVVLLLEIGTIRILLGGDLNDRSQKYLLEHYTGLAARPRTPEGEAALVGAARKVFEVDVAKACHHGSPHVFPLFLKATNPLATIISSGDNEPHGHPRADTLGMVGRFGRGDRPLIFATELARSGTEHIKHPNQVRRELRATMDENLAILRDGNSTPAERKLAEERLEEALSVIQRSVANYGMINLRTDGTRMIIAQRLERDRKKSVRWDIYRFERDSSGALRFKH